MEAYCSLEKNLLEFFMEAGNGEGGCLGKRTGRKEW
jgi:hypothetical protein